MYRPVLISTAVRISLALKIFSCVYMIFYEVLSRVNEPFVLLFLIFLDVFHSFENLEHDVRNSQHEPRH